MGLLFFDRKGELLQFVPDTKPEYVNPALSPYPALKDIGETERQDPYHYALSLIQRITGYTGQEIGTHTFCHYYCLEAGQTSDAFRADLAAARAAAKRIGVEPKSLVFPRNQFNAEYLEICRDAGIIAFRGNQVSWSYSAARDDDEARRIRRGYRLLEPTSTSPAITATRRTSIARGW